MAYDLDPNRSPGTPSGVVTGPSAPISLSSMLCQCSSEGEHAVDERLVEFWGDGHGLIVENSALAHATGHLHDVEIDPFLARIEEPVVFAEPLPLETETDEDRDVSNERLRRLARDGRLRRRYARLLRERWARVEPSWRDVAVPRALEAQRALQRRLDGGDELLSLFPAGHIARRDQGFIDMLRAAYADGTLRITPVLAKPHIIALPGVLSVCIQITPGDPVVAARREAEQIAARLRPLADPTRLTILTQLAEQPSSVSELARRLHIAQPTASVHLRQLRQAGLVSATRDGSRAIYRMRPDALAALLGEIDRRLTARVTPAAD
jgi:DNA-binding transcriptional ArsR family regulator